jgi:WD40 repeat protein
VAKDTLHYFKGVTSLKSQSGKEVLAVGDSVGSVYLIESAREGIYTNTLAYSMKPEVGVNCMTSINDKSYLVVGDVQGSVEVLTVKDTKEISLQKVIDCKTDNTPITALKNIEGKSFPLVAVGDYLGRIKLVNLMSFKIMAEIASHGRILTCLDYLAPRNLLVSGSEDTYVNVWQVDVDLARVKLYSSHCLENSMIIGCQFMQVASRTALVTSSYDARELVVINNVS